MKFADVKEDQTFLHNSIRHQRIEKHMVIGSKKANAAYITDDGKGIVTCFIKDDEDVLDMSDVRLDFPNIFEGLC